MARKHLFELEDQSWCPKTIREATTDFLSTLYHVLDIYEPAYRKINEILDKTKMNAIVDCCSGSGGPVEKLREHLDKQGKYAVKITLTDKYPNHEAFKRLENQYQNKIVGYKDPINASQMPSSLFGMRTFFSSFHHFTPPQCVKILQDAVNNQVPIGIFECTQRQPMDFIRTLLSPIMMIILTPLAKRMTWKKFIFTYIFPIILFTNMWDYFVSNMRTYSPKEMQELINQLDAPGYHWEVGKLWSNKAKCEVPYLVGYKK